jgi:hypothetical protein
MNQGLGIVFCIRLTKTYSKCYNMSDMPNRETGTPAPKGAEINHGYKVPDVTPVPEHRGSGKAKNVLRRAGRVAAVGAGAAIVLSGADAISHSDQTGSNDKQTSHSATADTPRFQNPLKIDFGTPQDIPVRAVAQQEPLSPAAPTTPDTTEHKVVRGDTVSAVAAQALKDAGADAKDHDNVLDVTEVIGALTPSVKDLNKIDYGKLQDVLNVPSTDVVREIADASANKGDADVIKAVQALEKELKDDKGDVNKARPAATAVIDALGVQVPAAPVNPDTLVPAPAEDTTPGPGVNYEIKKSDTVSEIADDNLKAAGFAHASGDQEKVEKALIGAVNDIKNLNQIRAGTTITVPENAVTYQVAQAVDGQGDAAVVAAVDKVVHTPNLNAARDQAYDLAKVLRFSAPSPDAGKTVDAAKPFGVELLKPRLTDAETTAAVALAKTNGWVKDSSLQDKYNTIWSQQKGEGKQDNAQTNLTSRIAVQLSKFDENLNSKTKFDEHNMHHSDESSKFVEANDGVQPFLRGVAALSDEQMVALQKAIPATEFQLLATLRQVDHGPSGPEEVVKARDRAALEVYLAVAKTVNLNTLPPEIATFLKGLEGKSQEDIAKAMAENPAEVQQLFQEAAAEIAAHANPSTEPRPSQNPDRNAPQTTGPEQSTSPTTSAAPTTPDVPKTTEAPAPTTQAGPVVTGIPDASSDNWFSKSWGWIAGGVSALALLSGGWFGGRYLGKRKRQKEENEALARYEKRLQDNEKRLQDIAQSLVDSAPLTLDQEKEFKRYNPSDIPPNSFTTTRLNEVADLLNRISELKPMNVDPVRIINNLRTNDLVNPVDEAHEREYRIFHRSRPATDTGSRNYDYFDVESEDKDIVS